MKHEERVSDPQTSSAPGFYLYAIGDERSPRAIFPRSRRAHECSVFRRSCVEWPRNWCSPSASDPNRVRSEEHTSELQSLMRTSYAVFCLKKNTTKIENNRSTTNNSKIRKKIST